jgi:hypothetical protein
MIIRRGNQAVVETVVAPVAIDGTRVADTGTSTTPARARPSPTRRCRW